MNKSMLAVISLFLCLSGCSHHPSQGDEMMAQSAEAEKLGKKWNKGHNMSKKGHKKMESGEELVERGRSEINKGKKMMSKGEMMTHLSEDKFEAEFPQVDTDTN